MESGNKSMLLGDSTYSLKHYLLSPYRKAANKAQDDFNIACETLSIGVLLIFTILLTESESDHDKSDNRDFRVFVPHLIWQAFHCYR